MPPILIILIIIVYVFTQVLEFVKEVLPFLKLFTLIIVGFLFMWLVAYIIYRCFDKEDEKADKNNVNINITTKDKDKQQQTISADITSSQFIQEVLNPKIEQKTQFNKNSINTIPQTSSEKDNITEVWNKDDVHTVSSTTKNSAEVSHKKIQREVVSNFNITENREAEKETDTDKLQENTAEIYQTTINAEAKFKWYGKNETVNFHGYIIKNPMIYVGTNLSAKIRSTSCGNDACLVNPHLEVENKNDSSTATQIPYHPHYSEITPLARKNYLQWLEGGRVEPSIYIGYVFLFFYGLERRLFYDLRYAPSQENEVNDIIEEVIRLSEIYSENQSFFSCAKKFLAMATIMYGTDESYPDYLKNYNQDQSTLLFLQYSIAKLVAMQKPITAELAFEWIIAHPNYKPYFSAKKCPQLFRDFFSIKYREKYGKGIILYSSSDELETVYHTASVSLSEIIYFSDSFLPVPHYTEDIEKELFEIIDYCSNKISEYARYLDRNEDTINLLILVSLLPKEYTSSLGVVKECKEKLMQVASSHTSIEIREIYEYFHETIPKKFTKKEQELLIKVLQSLGFDFVPNLNHHNVKLNKNSRVILYCCEEENNHFQPSVAYLNLCLQLEICELLTNYGAFTNLTSNKLQKYITESHSFSQVEKNSLVAFLCWVIDYSPMRNEIVKKVEILDKSQKKLLMKSLFDIIKFIDSTDNVAPEKIGKIESILGIENENNINPIQIPIKPNEPIQEDKTIIKPEILESIVQTIAIKSKEDTNILPLPKEQPQKVKFTLDKELINRHEKETAEVQVLLNSIFTENDENMEAIDEKTAIKHSLIEKLDSAYQNFFFTLIKQETWERSDITELCKTNNLMLDGAMEILNDWAYTYTDSPLLEDVDTTIYIDLEIVKELTQDG